MPLLFAYAIIRFSHDLAHLLHTIAVLCKILLYLVGNITGLIPHTEYKISLTACTSGGCAESPDAEGLIITTKEEGIVKF